MKINLILLMVSLLTANICFSQRVEKGSEFTELVKIADRYEHTPDLNFKMKFIYSDSSSQKGILDSNSVTYKISDGNIFMFNNEMEMLQNSNGAIYLDKEDSTVFINNLIGKPILQIPLMDSIFRSAHIAGMDVKDLNDSTRILTFLFNPGSYYHAYQITYMTDIHVIKQIKYYVPSEGKYELPENSVLCVQIEMSDYNMDHNDPALFNEGRYIYQLNKKNYLQPAYRNYKLQTIQ